MKSSAKNIRMPSIDDLFQTSEEIEDASKEKVQEISLDQLFPFRNHPFKVLDDDSMKDMVESITQYGILVPALARPREEGGYELIAGHRRKHASELAGKKTMPVLVRDMSDDEAVIVMVDSNIQRENLYPSEKAWAYRMKLDAIKHQGERSDLTSPQVGQKLGWAVNQVASDSKESKSQIQRYIRLTELLPELLQMTDDKKLPFNTAVELSYLTQDEQARILAIMQQHTVVPSLEQAGRLKKYSQSGTLTEAVMIEILRKERSAPVKVTLKNDKLRHYFPQNYTQQQMEEVIFSLLDSWKCQNQ